MSLKASMKAVHRDVTTYVSDLEQRISRLEQVASNLESSPNLDSSFSSMSNAKKQFDEINKTVDSWDPKNMENDIQNIENEIDSFLNEKLPKAVQPFSKALNEWKSKFNIAMTVAGQKYQKLNKDLSIDSSEVKQASKNFVNQRRQLNQLMREIESIPNACERLDSQVQDLIEDQKRELSISLSSLSQQLQIDIMRAKATSNSAIAQSLSNCQSSSFNEFFNSLQNDINQQCAQMENNIKDVHNILDTAEKQWESDILELKDEIKSQVTAIQHSVGTNFALQQKLKEANEKAKELEYLIARI